jgi:hypothetical protein
MDLVRCRSFQASESQLIEEIWVMPDIKSLAGRIDAEFSAAAEKIRRFQAEKVEEHKARQKRLQQLGGTFDELRDIWKPRLELLANKFKDTVRVTPKLTPSRREAVFEFRFRSPHDDTGRETAWGCLKKRNSQGSMTRFPAAFGTVTTPWRLRRRPRFESF